MKLAFLYLFLTTWATLLDAQPPACEYILPNHVKEIPRNACFELTMQVCQDCTMASSLKLIRPYVCSASDTTELRVLAAFEVENSVQLLLQPTALLAPDTDYRIWTMKAGILKGFWQTNAIIADDLVAFRAQPRLTFPKKDAASALQIRLSLHADAWHWLKIEVVNKWTGASRSWLEGGQGAERFIQKPKGFSWFAPDAQSGDEFDIFVTPISIDGAEGRRSEPVTLVLP